jgi:8-oxo-dGTP pyrophosphatase MutT (NUDIX family)
MSRRHLLDMLARYRGLFPEEASIVDRMCSLVESHADCFERTCRPGHVTGAAWIISADRRRCLLAHHRKLDRWLQLGGHADGQWQVDEVALREAREESGMRGFDFVPIRGTLMPFDVDIHQIPERRDAQGNLIEDAHEHYDVRFLLVARRDESIHISDESHDVAWFTPGEVRQRTDEESVLRMLTKALNLLS